MHKCLPPLRKVQQLDGIDDLVSQICIVERLFRCAQKQAGPFEIHTEITSVTRLEEDACMLCLAPLTCLRSACMRLLRRCPPGAVPIFLFLLFCVSCERQQAAIQPVPQKRDTSSAPSPVLKAVPQQPEFHYFFLSQHNKDEAVRDSARHFLKRLSKSELEIVLLLNRVDAATLNRLDTLVVPVPLDTDRMAYSVFPTELTPLRQVKKMVLLAYYPEVFAAYENGRLVRWGPTSMGKKSTPTPTGLFSCNWKSLESISSIDESWKLKWNFNVWNKGGVGWHEFQMPGHPASHACVRLQEADAKFLYNWADQWILKDGALAAQGTPVLIFGSYPFGKGKPWWKLVHDPDALQLTTDSLSKILEPYLSKILARQAQRDSLLAL